MWDTTFDISMLDNEKIIISCPERYLANELMNILAENGVRWAGGGKVPSEQNSLWDDYEEETCYWVEGGTLSYGDKPSVEHYRDEWIHHIKCTFLDVGLPQDFEVATDDELLTFLGVRG